MMITNPDQAIAAIRTLQLPSVFLDIWERKVPPGIYDVCQPPRRFFKILDDIQKVFSRVKHVIPLWEEFGESIVGYDSSADEFIEYQYAPPGDVYEVMGSSYQTFLTEFFVQLIDSGVCKELDELSSLFEYKHLDRLKDLAEKTSDDKWDEEYQKFLNSIN